MTPSQWRRVRDVFERLVDLDAGEARRSLDADVTDDETVRLEVLSLLDQHSRAGSFLVTPPPLEQLGIGSDLKAGAAVGPYTIVREIGHGGMGRVYLADDTRLQRHVCLKIVREDLSGDAQFRERLRREARLAASLSHPGICAVYALEEFDGHIYLVTEFVEGRTLREEMQSGRLPPAADVLQTMKEIAAALAAAHAKGITHRDLKPENVMRSASGQLKILDFGLARTDGEPVPGANPTLPGVVVGTPAYMAPEQINGGRVDRRADLFAFGVVMYEYTAGQHPFASPSPLGVAARIVDQTPSPLAQRRPDLPASLTAAVDRCLQKNPDDRFATAQELIAALDSEDVGQVKTNKPAAWWRLHQLAAIGLYLTACSAAWLLKEWASSTAALWAFVLIGAFAAINGVVRGHLLFTERTAPGRLAMEHRKSRRFMFALDLAIAAVLIVIAGFMADVRPVAAVLVIGLAAGIGLAAALIEPATNAAAFDPS